MTWHYQICVTEKNNEKLYSLREVYVDTSNKDDISWGDAIDGFYNSPEDIIETLKMQLKDATERDIQKIPVEDTSE